MTSCSKQIRFTAAPVTDSGDIQFELFPLHSLLLLEPLLVLFLPSLKCLNLAGNLAWLRLRCMHMYNLTGRHKRCPVMSLLQGRKYFFLPCLLQQGLQTSCTKKDAIASFHSTAKNILWINLCKKLITYSNIRFFQKHKNMYGLSDSLFMFHSFCFSYHRTQNVLCT